MTSQTPPTGWQLAPSAVPGIVVYEPIPDDPSRLDAPDGGYRCPRCAGPMAFSPEQGALACEQCSYAAATQAEPAEIKTTRFTEAAIREASESWTLERRDLHCDGCGVDLAIAPGTLVVNCPFCGSNQVLLREGTVRGLRPSAVLPFAVEHESLTEPVRAWLGAGWLHPSDLASHALLERFSGIYLPFWLFDARCDARWTAEVGRSVARTVRRNGRSVVEHRIEWRRASGRIRLDLNNRRVFGSTRVALGLIRSAGPYHLADLVPYAPGFLAGWQALTYDIGLTEAWDRARAGMREHVRQECGRDTGHDRVRNLAVRADFDDERWRYALLPMHLCAYTYNGKSYSIAVNGQTGVVAGSRPVVWPRVHMAIAGLFTPGVVLGLVGLALLFVGIGALVLILALILLLLAGMGSFLLVKHALFLEDPQ
ncbi:MAG: hypothetical protein AB8H79_04250 [Myxococcota bacterium]